MKRPSKDKTGCGRPPVAARCCNSIPTQGRSCTVTATECTIALAIHPTTGEVYVTTNRGVEIFDPDTGEFRRFSRDENLRFGSLAFRTDGSLWGVTWPDRRTVVRFTNKARAEVMHRFDTDIDSIAFGQANTVLAGLLFVTHNSGKDGAGSELTMIDLATSRQVAVAQRRERAAMRSPRPLTAEF